MLDCRPVRVCLSSGIVGLASAAAQSIAAYRKRDFVLIMRSPYEDGSYCGGVMQDEAEITISGVKLSAEESMTVRVAIDTLANVLAEELEDPESRVMADRYAASLSRIQTLLETREARKQ